MYEVECPYCDKTFNVDLEGSQYEDDNISECECKFCDKNFVFTTSIMITLNSSKADCLNGSEHYFKPAHICPVHSSTVRTFMCNNCGYTKQFSIDEIEKNDMPYTEDWKKFDRLKGQG